MHLLVTKLATFLPRGELRSAVLVFLCMGKQVNQPTLFDQQLQFIEALTPMCTDLSETALTSP